MDTPGGAPQQLVVMVSQRNLTRGGRAQVPLVGMLATRKRLVPPTAAEGFDRVDVVRAVPLLSTGQPEAPHARVP